MVSTVSALNNTNVKSEPFLEKVSSAFKMFEETIWEYINQLGKATKQIMKAIVVKVPEYAERLARVISSISLLTGVSVLLSFFRSLPSDLEAMKKNIMLHDPEGAALASFGLLATLGDILDNIGTVAGGLSELGAFPKIAFFGLIGLPLATGLLGYVLLARTYQIIRNGCFLSSLPKEITAENSAEFEAFIRAHIDDIDQKAKERKVHILSRHADPKVCRILEKLQVSDLQRANQALQDIKSIMRRKITLSCIGTVMNIALLTTLVASTIFALNPLVIPVILGLKATVSLGTHCYKSHFINNGLNNAV